jgi:hypothetical protein
VQVTEQRRWQCVGLDAPWPLVGRPSLHGSCGLPLPGPHLVVNAGFGTGEIPALQLVQVSTSPPSLYVSTAQIWQVGFTWLFKLILYPPAASTVYIKFGQLVPLYAKVTELPSFSVIPSAITGVTGLQPVMVRWPTVNRH